MKLQPLDPFHPEALALLKASDDFHAALYPAESNHLLDPAALLPPQVLLLGAHAEDGRLLGMGAVRRCEEAGLRYVELKRFFVRHDARGRGVAAALLEALEAAARAEGFACARLETGIHQPEALRLYRAAGYQDCGPFGDYAPDPLSVFMEKPL
ncbi:MAG: GNAT family N-acetyltransferase [Burkholderiales bacterium]|nr:GNAT family N-acetyltransferase [Burkholderiales bacterium]